MIFKVAELIPNQSGSGSQGIVICIGSAIRPNEGREIAVDLSSENGETRITMTNVGLIPEVECDNHCAAGWNFYVIESLLKLLTEGKGLPDRSGK